MPRLSELGEDCEIKQARAQTGRVHRRTRQTGAKIEMEDREIRTAVDRHWAASDADDFEAEHQI